VPGPICTCGRMSSSDMMMTVAIDNEKLKPVNVSEVGIRTNKKINTEKIGGTKTNSVWLDSSFVHLMTPRNNIRTTKDYGENLAPSQNSYQQIHQGQLYSQHGFLEQHEHLLQLLEAAYTHVGDIEHSNNFAGKKNNINNHDHGGEVELCVDCIDRVASALEANTQRLYAEVEVYHSTVQTSKHRSKALQRTTKDVTSAGIATNSMLKHTATASQTSNNNNKSINNDTIEEAYQEEISMLEREIQARCDELLHYKSIHKEQTQITSELSRLEESLQLKENSLKLQSEAFDNRRHILTKSLSEVQSEVDKLTCVSLPRALFDLQVDQARGLHYPLINQLRLAFRPKGDVPAKEIQVAWSQATQLLLILGTLLEYPGLDWKLVPLADCAKLIYRKEIFNLVPGDCRSLMAWNALLDQVVKHALSIATGFSSNSGNCTDSTTIPRNKHVQYENRIDTKSTEITSTRTNDPHMILKPIPPPYSSSPTMIGFTELARLDPIDHFGWSQVIHRMASNLLWLSNRASNLSATQVSSLTHCVV